MLTRLSRTAQHPHPRSPTSMVSGRRRRNHGVWVEKTLHRKQGEEVCYASISSSSQPAASPVNIHTPYHGHATCVTRALPPFYYSKSPRKSLWSPSSVHVPTNLSPCSSELAREKMWSRIYITPLLQAEEDRDQIRRYWADQAREKELLGSTSSPYNSDRYVTFCPEPMYKGRGL
jgi:hypothetical protein